MRARVFGVNTYSYIFSHTARDAIDHLARRGYSTFELMLFPGHLWPPELDAGARRALRAHLAAAEARVLTLNIPSIDINLAAASREMRDYSLSMLRNAVILAGDLGIPGVLFGPGKPNPLFPMPRERMTGYFFAALDELAPVAEKCGTRILVENIPIAFLPDADNLMSALDRYGNPDIEVVYDVANAVYHREDPLAGLRRVQSRLRLVHVSDTGLDAYRHDPVGHGVVPFRDIPAVLDEISYGEVAMLEIITRAPDQDIASSVEKLSAMGWINDGTPKTTTVSGC